MLKGFFSPDNPVWRFFILLGRIWWLNILWIICSLPIFTMGAATTALIYSCMKLRADDGYPTKNFFRSFRENFAQATILGLIYLILAILIALGLIFWNHSTLPFAKIAWGIVLAVGILYCISIMYVFAIQSKFINPVKDTIKYSVLMAFTNFRSTVLIALVLIGVVLLNIYSYFIVNFITLNIGIGITTYLVSFHYQVVFRKYIPEPGYTESYLDQLERESESDKERKRRERQEQRMGR